MKIVAKFGGSSMANAEQFKKVKQIINHNPNRKFVVVSAAGKGVGNPTKLTDQLIQIYNAVHDGSNWQKLVQNVEERLLNLKRSLNLKIKIEDLFNQFVKQLPDISYDELISRGEYFTACLMADYLEWPMLDSQNFLVINNGQVDFNTSKRRFFNLIKSADHFVIPGFYGVDNLDNIQLLPRGGSDTTGAIVSNLIDADTYENWTDTNGILVTDPTVVKKPDSIKQLSYDELQELAYLGMKVFQEEAIQPVREKQIPIVIKNTNYPDYAGTWVSNRYNHNQRLITGIAGKKNQSIIMVHKYQLSNNISGLLQLLETAKRLSPDFSYSFSGADRLNLTLNNCSNEKLSKIISNIKLCVKPDKVKVDRSIAVIGLVTDNFKNDPMLAATIVNNLRSNNVLVKAIVQESGEGKLILRVNNQEYKKIIQLLYQLNLESSANEKIVRVR